MGLHIGVCCDFCSTTQSMAFDSLTETYRDLIDAMRGAGWRITLSEAHRVVGASCPDCLPTRTATDPDGTFGP